MNTLITGIVAIWMMTFQLISCELREQVSAFLLLRIAMSSL